MPGGQIVNVFHIYYTSLCLWTDDIPDVYPVELGCCSDDQVTDRLDHIRWWRTQSHLNKSFKLKERSICSDRE